MVLLWPAGEAHQFLLSRLRLHIAAEGGQYQPCTDEERWMRHSWAVYKKDRDGRAVRAGFRTEEEAREYANAKLEPLQTVHSFYDIVLREGEPVRCMNWCPVSSVCPQWARDKEVREGNLERDLRDSLVVLQGGKP